MALPTPAAQASRAVWPGLRSAGDQHEQVDELPDAERPGESSDKLDDKQAASLATCSGDSNTRSATNSHDKQPTARYANNNNNNNSNNDHLSQQQLEQVAGSERRRMRRRSSAGLQLAQSAGGQAKDEADIVFNRLVRFEPFRKLPAAVIRNLCSYAFVERIEKGVIVFRQGDDAINWYALLEGSVDVRVSQSGSLGAKDGVTLCTLGVGTTFGASRESGKAHSVSVVTADQCTMLRVRRADFPEIFNQEQQSHLLAGPHDLEPFCVGSSLFSAGRRSPSMQRQQHFRRASVQSADSAGSEQRGPLRADHAAPEAEDEEPYEGAGAQLARLSLESAPDELRTRLFRAAWCLRALALHQAPELVQNRRLLQRRPSHSLHQHRNPAHQPHPRKRLVSAGSSSQLLAGRSAGRRVASYVASSLMGRGRQAEPPPVQPLTSNSFELADGEAPSGPASSNVARCMVGRELVDWLLGLGQVAGQTGAARFVGSRLQAASMWQVLVEPGALVAVGPQASRQFSDDPHAYYQFWCDANQAEPADTPDDQELARAHEWLWRALKLLAHRAPDACFRLILAKPAAERTPEEVDIVFEELQHLKALSHLGNGVKKQLAACVSGEQHPKQNTVIFNQGDQGQSWYIILRGSVNVVIVGKGVVCTLHEADDFGKLALVNDAPRAATIVTSEPDCYFLRVDKLDFNTILRHVEANTVRLKEHGQEVLILQRVPAGRDQQAGPQPGAAAEPPVGQSAAPGPEAAGQPAASGGAGSGAAAPSAASSSGALAVQSSALKYMVMAGTGEKMLEHLLETRIDGQSQIGPLVSCKSRLFQHDQVSAYIQTGNGDNFLEDFILTHKIFMPTGNLCQELLKHYQCQPRHHQARQLEPNGDRQPEPATSGHSPAALLDDEYLVAKKRRVVKFVRCWMLISREQFFHQHQIQSFLTTLHLKVKQDASKFPSLQPELKAIARILELHLEEELDGKHRGVQRWLADTYGNMLPLRRLGPGHWHPPAAPTSGADEEAGQLAALHLRRLELEPAPVAAHDEVVFRVYCADHTFATVRARLDAEAAQVKQVAARRLRLTDKELILVHVKSNGERIIFNDQEANLCTSLSVNGRIFVCPLDHIDAISPLPDQDPFQELYATILGAPASSCSIQPLPAAHSHANCQSAAGANTSGPAPAGPNQTGVVGPSGSHQQQQPPATTTTGEPISSHLLANTPSCYADIKAQMGLSCAKLEEFSSRDIAYCLTQLGWALLKNMHEFELIYSLFGRHNFQNHKQITANLNVLLRHFNEIQYWVVTQVCLSSSLSKRVQILRKFVKIAAHCRELQNLNAFFAIIMGLSNMAVARLTQTWEKLPSKLKRTFSQFESLIDPSRNHRRYRIFLSKMEPPIIPFMPLLLKDMTFAHEGNKTLLENGLINFEKMQMVAQTLRTIRYCKSQPLKLDPSFCKYKGSVRNIELFFRDLKIIDNQRTLTQMSHQLEHRKT